MDTQLWSLFRETGDPLGYLLYKAGKKPGEKQKEPKKNARGEEKQTLSL